MNSKLTDQTHIPTKTPTPRQLEYQEWEMGLFLCFGIRTFYEGHKDWDKKPMPPDGFLPAGLNCDNWIVSGKRAGMRYTVLTCKHHDGFANWPSRHSRYTVAQTPWKNGKGDVVREYVEACHRHEMKIGLYYSPAEWGNPLFDDEKAYDEYLLNQLHELLSDYGDIDMLWIDGCGSENHTYDWPRIISEIRNLQPNMLLFNKYDPDYRWIGNEAGIASLPTWNSAIKPRLCVNNEGKVELVEQPMWLPAECDCMIRWHTWYSGEGDAHTVKPLEELMGLYYLSVGRGTNLLLNVGPDRRGLLPDGDRKALLAFGEEIQHRFGSPLAKLEDGTLTDTSWEYANQEPFYVDHVILQENLAQGESVRRFAIHIVTSITKRMVTIYEGRNIGHKAICRFPLVACDKIVIEVTESDGPVRFHEVTLHNSTGLAHKH